MVHPLVFLALLTVTSLSAARLAYVQAVTIPLFRCDTAAASSQLTLCPQIGSEIAHTPIPRQFHGPVRVLAEQLRTESTHCVWILRSGAQRYLHTATASLRQRRAVRARWLSL